MGPSPNAALRKKRDNPHVLFPGDELFIPDKEERQEAGTTETIHRFRLRAQPLTLRLALKDFDHQPLANIPCELHVEGAVHQLTTDSAGRIQQPISTKAESAVLVFKDPLVPFPLGIPLKIGHLDPVEELSGQEGRLNNLGYHAGALDDPIDDRFRFAVQEFQCDHGLQVDGLCGPHTQAKLKDVHGS